MRLADGDVLVHDDFAIARADDACDQVADSDGHLPPAFIPGADPASGPGLGILVHAFFCTVGHGAEGMTDEVGGFFGEREFSAPVEKRVHRRSMVAV